MLENKGCSDKEIEFVDCGCDLGNVDFSEGCRGKILIIGNSGIHSATAKAIKEIEKAIEDLKSPIPFGKVRGLMEEIKLCRDFKEKPQKRNFVNKFNKNQHRK